MTTKLMVPQKLPIIPMLMHPLTGENIREDRLMLRPGLLDAETGMVDYRDRHAPETQPYYRLYFTEPVREKDKVRVRYMWSREPRKTRVVGVTDSSPEAVRILIGNNLAGCWMGGGIRWELYEDRECENLLAMGRIDQWDLLRDISPERFAELAQRQVRPVGNWDFDGLLWRQTCSVCGQPVAVNVHLYNIDSAVCEKCGNRPYLAPALHKGLDEAEWLPTTDAGVLTLRVLQWMSHVGSTFGEVRRDTDDMFGRRLKNLAEKTLIWRATERDSQDEVRTLVESNTQINFVMYEGACVLLRKAMTGEVAFTEEHRLAAEFVAKATELVRVRQLSTKK